MIPTFPKPGQEKKPQEAVKVYRNGREKCTDTKAGRDEYERRKRIAWEDQGKTCKICGKKLNWSDSFVDHIRPRGMGSGFRDDRQPNIAAVHWACNSAKGSRRIEEFLDVP